MRMILKLLVLAVLGAIPAQASGQTFDRDLEPARLEEPLRTTLLVAGRSAPIRGEITAWYFGGFWVQRRDDASLVRIEWDQLKANKVYETARRLIDREDAIGYLGLGIEMLRLDERRLADRAFAFSMRLEPNLKKDVEQAIGLSEKGEDPAPVYAAAQGRLQEAPETPDGPDTRSPAPIEASQAKSGIDPWEPLGDEERTQAIDAQRQFAQTAGYGVGDNKRRVYETDHFIVATDLDERAMRRWGDQLEVMYETMIMTLSLEKDADLYAGKCMVFIFGTRGAYLRFERKAMNYDATRSGGVCHYRGNDVILAFYRRGSDAEFQSVLVHESVHGFLYRYRSPAGLPTWANEGLADYIAGHLTPASGEPREHWNHSKNFILQKKDPMDIMRQTYRNGTWYDDDSYPVSHMLVRFLLRYKPVEFKQWIDDIKAGAEWEEAMQRCFGVDAATLARGFADEIKSEKMFTRNQ
jgi:hypothetical protein